MIPNPKTGKAHPRILPLPEAFVKVIGTGVSIDTACAIVGISKQTVYDWLARAEEHRDADPVPDGEQDYLDFSDSLMRARETVVSIATAGIVEAGKSDWRAYGWFLERSRPEEWGRSTRVDLGAVGADGGRTTLAELMAAAVTDPSTASDDDDPDLN